MPRNATGVYTLPQAAFQANTVIASAAMNSNLSDMAQALTQSLATTGVTSMSGQFLAASGSIGAPGISFSSQSNSGLYLAGTNQIGIVTAGTQAVTVNSDQSVTMDGNLTVFGTINNSNAVPATIPVGAVVDFAGTSAPSGWLLCFGQSVSAATYAALFAVIGTTYGGGGGNFNLPDYRGFVLAGKDNMGGSAAGRIGTVVTDSGTIVGTTLGSIGGSSTHVQTGSELAVHSHTGSGNVSDPGHAHQPSDGGSFVSAGAGGVFYGAGGGAAEAVGTTTTNTTGVTVPSLNISNSGSSSAMSLLQYTAITNKIIYSGHA